MKDYLKKHATQAAYTTWAASANYVTPNVSLINADGEVKYNPYNDSGSDSESETRLVCKYNITDDKVNNKIYLFGDMWNSGSGSGSGSGDDETLSLPFTAMEIDGNEETVTNQYTFDTVGEHTVKFTLVDPTILNEYLFMYCYNLTSITIPNSVTSISMNVFYNCTGLTSITIPSSVTSIGDYAFANCSGLTSIIISDSVTSIGFCAFSSCSGITSITVDTNNLTYDSRNNSNAIIETSTNILIIGCKNTIIPNNITSIGNSAFSGCSGLTSITIPNSVTSIGDGAFSSCSGLTSVTIPNSVTSIGDNAFTGCSGLTSITISSSVTSIGDAFKSCSGLTSIICNATTAPTIKSYTFYAIKTNGTLIVPSGSTGYDVWMGTGDHYLGKYGWTKVEQ